jgi:hypothetical protein
MAQLTTDQTLPTSSEDALRLFDERYLALRLLQRPEMWCQTLGEYHPTGSPHTKYPMSFLALKYRETIDQGGRFRTIGEKDCDLEVVEYDDGVEIELMKLLLNTFSARRWMDAPAGMLQAEDVFKCQTIATMLEANTATCGWDDLALFHDTHYANPRNHKLGTSSDVTFDNLQASTKDVVSFANLEAEITLMMAIKDENGDKLGVKPDTVGVPTEKFQPLVNLLKQDLIANSGGTATIRNPYADGTLKVVHMPQLTDVNDWYLFDSKLIAQGVAPWVLAKLQLSMPGFDALGMRRHDQTSEMFLRNGKIGVSSHIWYGAKFLYPHAIRKIAGA